MRIFIFPVLLFFILLTHSCITAPKTLMRNDPLIGKKVQTSTREFVNFTTMMDALENHDVIYLSEKHDNPMHHAIQHRIIQDLVNRGRSPVVGFEFFSFHNTPLLLSLMDSKKARHTPETEKQVEIQMRKKLGWDNQSDEMWAYYWDLLTLTRDNGLWAAGLDLSSSQKRRITRKGVENLTPIEKKQIFTTEFSNPVYESHMKSIFKTVHCGMDHGKMTARLYDTWTARNDRMALSIVQLYDAGQTRDSNSQTRGPIVIIMGNGHTEYGLGVINRVKFLNPKISQVNLAMTEIFRDPAGLEDYLVPLELEGFAPVPPADYIWLTQRVSYGDPCQKFKAALEKMKNLPPSGAPKEKPGPKE
jgi:uncharacterized iron-regulated protein